MFSLLHSTGGIHCSLPRSFAHRSDARWNICKLPGSGCAAAKQSVWLRPIDNVWPHCSLLQKKQLVDHMLGQHRQCRKGSPKLSSFGLLMSTQAQVLRRGEVAIEFAEPATTPPNTPPPVSHPEPLRLQHVRPDHACAHTANFNSAWHRGMWRICCQASNRCHHANAPVLQFHSPSSVEVFLGAAILAVAWAHAIAYNKSEPHFLSNVADGDKEMTSAVFSVQQADPRGPRRVAGRMHRSPEVKLQNASMSSIPRCGCSLWPGCPQQPIWIIKFKT